MSIVTDEFKDFWVGILGGLAFLLTFMVAALLFIPTLGHSIRLWNKLWGDPLLRDIL